MRGLGAAAAVAVLTAFVYTAHAQQKAPEPAAPVAKTEKKAKPKSVCNGLPDEAACKANTSCTWVAAVSDAQTGKQKRKAHCRTKAKAAKKKDPAKTDPAKK